ncbi:MAG: site-specific integrase [Clostridium sp.]|nr:site-specific integrase [Clostridium sp.]
MRRNSRNKKIKFLTKNELAELFARINLDASDYAVRNRAIFYIAKYCALRASEIGLIHLNDYDPTSHLVYCERLKGSQSNTLKIVDNKVCDALNAYYSIRILMPTESPFLFLSRLNRPISRKTLDLIFKQYCTGTHIPQDKRHFHTLKHTRAMELIEYRLELRDVQWWLGHANLSNTMIYLNFTTAAQDRLFNRLAILENAL